ncbi:MAG: RnfABCDGE type electron transport complex subunit D [Clostridia bacterium]|nr:RnfABCDGE type electron transport complex subunit D [Clostridia bacterium]
MARIQTAPYVHTQRTSLSRGYEWLAALCPILVWSIYMFGARVVTLCLIGGGLSLGLDYIVQRFVFKMKRGARLDMMSLVYGILAVFSMPVAVALYLPIISAILVVIAKNARIIRAHRLFNPFVFSAAVLGICFKSQMTCFTRPFAYFSPFTVSLDPKLVEGYRVISPLQFMADGSVYEDGVMAQLYGFASGCIGEIAVAAMILSLIWLCIRREADWRGPVAMLAPILLLSLVFPSSDAESNYYAYSVILSGAIFFLSVFATNESCTVPQTKNGRYIFGAACGIIIFLLRKAGGGFEWGYAVVLVLNAVSPFIEMLTKPKLATKKNGKAKVKK